MSNDSRFGAPPVGGIEEVSSVSSAAAAHPAASDSPANDPAARNSAGDMASSSPMCVAVENEQSPSSAHTTNNNPATLDRDQSSLAQDLAQELDLFSDLPNDLAQLRFHHSAPDPPACRPTIHPGLQLPPENHDASNRTQTIIQPQTSHHNHIAPPASSPTNNHARSNHPSQSPHAAALARSDFDSASSSAHAPLPPPASPARVTARKPSPGLAARLKALGFGTSTGDSKPPPSIARIDHVGRLPEDQLRQLDESHQAGSEVPAVERRGRPWKGALVRIPSKASLKKFRPGSSKKSPDAVSLPANDAVVAPAAPDTVELLPEIQQSPPLDMDTNKFRLPDHANGNGTKAQPEMRRQHIERGDTMSPISPDDAPPPPPPKDSPPLSSATETASTPATEFSQEIYFNPLGLQRAGSIYTLSRASFANQLAQLTSLQLPDAESLSGKVAAIPTAQAATRALIGAAEQIRNWISKASEVIGGLDSDDDVEWSAAGGREGLEEVESAIGRFEELIKVYLSAIEDLNSRPDIGSVSSDDLERTVSQMESITHEWANIHVTLKTVKGQVEIAMEWEELWNMVLRDIQNEMDELTRLVFEMEERRHKSIMAGNSADGVDIGDLETIVEETPPAATRLRAANSHRFSLPAFPASPSSPIPPSLSQDDSSLLALFARMQPLRASLDFLPMRLSVFAARAQANFPSACAELETRQQDLDNSYKKLEKDAENLRKELGEDRWVLVFRSAGRQAQKMYESVERSVSKLKEAIDADVHLSNPAMVSKKIESYEAKKLHYSPAIERILNIIDRGVKDRLTVNGEIVRLHTELQGKWDDLRERMRDMDLSLDELSIDRNGQQLRDSISSMLSGDLSTLESGHDTPQSSPPSSVIMSSLGLETPTSRAVNKRRSSGATSALPKPANRRSISATGASTQPVQRRPVSRLATTGNLTVTNPGREGSITPNAKSRASSLARSSSSLPNRPRWNSSTNGVDTGHNFKPLAVEQPQTTPSPRISSSRLPMRSPLSGRAGSASPAPDSTTPSKPPSSHSRFSFRERLASPGPYSQQATATSRAGQPRLNTQASMSSLSTRRASLQPPGRMTGGGGAEGPMGSSPSRPASSLAAINPRRSSMLIPGTRLFKDGVGRSGSMSGRESPAQSSAAARVAAFRKSQTDGGSKAGDGKPRWRF